ncbi:MAG: YihY/virulence factor BrkB family protein [Armatimonadetes bacterium]|nr:YihY/virulence factor BrkB family protein [Armatimonadota bacterium]
MSDEANQHSSEIPLENKSRFSLSGLQGAWALLVQTVKDCFTDNVPQWAAAVAFYGLLSLFPFTLAAISIAAYFVDVNWAISKISDGMGEFLPRGEEVIKSTLRDVIQARGTVGILSILALLWTGSRVFGVLTMALNIAYDVDETFGFFKRLMMEGLFMLTAGVLFFLALSSSVFLRLFQGVLQFLPEEGNSVFWIVTEAVPGLLLLGTYFLVYQFVPRTNPKWQASVAGAGAATLLFMIARPLFLGYIQQFASYNLIYGSLAAVIILLIWAWIVAYITLFGGELASHVHMMYFEGRSPEEVGESHEERSPIRKKKRKDSSQRHAAPAH